MSNDGGPAFPHIADRVSGNARDGFVTRSITAGGMSLRDYFAAKALPALIMHNGEETADNFLINAANAYEYADAMLKARALASGQGKSAENAGAE